MLNADLKALNEHSDSYQATFKYHSDNEIGLAWYSRRMQEWLRGTSSRSLVSLGIGHQIVADGFLNGIAKELDRYVIVEGALDIIETFRRTHDLANNVSLVHSFFEDYVSDETFDAIEMGFVLEHVEDPEIVVQRFRKLLSSEGRMFIAVPNARSMHRQVGFAGGMMDDIYKLSEYDLRFGHRRYFDIETLTSLVEKSGLKVTRTEGIFLKPLTSEQLHKAELSPDALEGLCRFGVDYPDLCNAILVEAVHSR
jgi:SAM-dependent methyltransferase